MHQQSYLCNFSKKSDYELRLEVDLKAVSLISMSISEVLLFIATNSRACLQCLESKERFGFPAELIRLDSEDARNTAANGKYFQVTLVPTMVVIYGDGNTQMFVGAPKITQWMAMMVKSQREADRGVTSYTPAGGNMYGPRPNPPPRHSPEEDAPDRFKPTPVLIEDDEEEYSEPEPLPKPKKKASKQKPEPRKAPKKKKKPPVHFEEEDEVEYIEPAFEPAPRKSNKNPTNNKKSTKMDEVYNMAKQMEKDRKSSLGYKEEDLPRYH